MTYFRYECYGNNRAVQKTCLLLWWCPKRRKFSSWMQLFKILHSRKKKKIIIIIFLYLLSRIEIDNMDSTFLITKFVLKAFLNMMVMKSSIKQYPVLNWGWLNMIYASVWYKQHYIICLWWLWVWYMSRNLVFRYDLQLS